VTQWTYCVLRWIPLGHHKDSALKVRWIVQPGSAQFGGKACRTSDCRRLADANFYSTSPDMFLGEEVEAFAMMAGIVKLGTSVAIVLRFARTGLLRHRT
jgi:hypothetical protein